jgi:hypothetical protein
MASGTNALTFHNRAKEPGSRIVRIDGARVRESKACRPRAYTKVRCKFEMMALTDGAY